MHLYEITNTLSPEKFKAKPGSPVDAEFGMRSQEELGSGMYSTAFSTKQEPGTVRKVSNIMSEDELHRDGYFRYVQLLAKNDRFTSNPYFPKIYDVQVRKFSDSTTPSVIDYAYAVDMERLHDWSELSNKEALMLGKQMFYNFESIAKTHIEKNSWYKDRPSEGEHPRHMAYANALIDFIEEIFDSYKIKPTSKMTIFKDPYLKKAIMLLRSLRDKTRYEGVTIVFDIHDGNIMVRRGPTGPHIVFTDPVV